MKISIPRFPVQGVAALALAADLPVVTRIATPLLPAGVGPEDTQMHFGR